MKMILMDYLPVSNVKHGGKIMSKLIEISFPGGKKVNAKIGNLIIKTNQSVKNGGEGSAPSPFQLFLASLGACAGFYALEFCNARNIPVKGISMTMKCDFDKISEAILELSLILNYQKISRKNIKKL